MSNKVMIVWATLVTSILLGIYAFASYYKDELKYISLKEEVKSDVLNYIKEKNVKLPLNITSEELEEKGYIKELRLDDKVCAADIRVDKKFMFYNYDIDFTCISTEENNEKDTI